MKIGGKVFNSLGPSTLFWHSKLKALKGILKVWNKEVFGRVETKKEALRRISFWDDLEKEKELTLEEFRIRKRQEY